MNRRRITLLVAIILGVSGSLWFVLTRTDRGLLAEKVRSASQVIVYEGLPHPGYEEELLASEKESKSFVVLAGEPFYQQPLELKPGHHERLVQILGNPETYIPHRGPKNCGGFHADYAMECEVDGQKFVYRLCFGCGEVKVQGPNLNSYKDLNYLLRKDLIAILVEYQVHRPDSPEFRNSWRNAERERIAREKK